MCVLLVAFQINIREFDVALLKVTGKLQAFFAREEIFVQDGLAVVSRWDRARNGFAL